MTENMITESLSESMDCYCIKNGSFNSREFLIKEMLLELKYCQI